MPGKEFCTEHTPAQPALLADNVHASLSCPLSNVRIHPSIYTVYPAAFTAPLPPSAVR
jgi:hypothetical protein